MIGDRGHQQEEIGLTGEIEEVGVKGSMCRRGVTGGRDMIGVTEMTRQVIGSRVSRGTTEIIIQIQILIKEKLVSKIKDRKILNKILLRKYQIMKIMTRMATT